MRRIINNEQTRIRAVRSRESLRPKISSISLTVFDITGNVLDSTSVIQKMFAIPKIAELFVEFGAADYIELINMDGSKEIIKKDTI